MFETMVHATRALESDLIKTSRQYARLRRSKNPNVIFRDVKEPAANGPEVLARSLVATIESVDAAEELLTLDLAHNWTSQPILCNGNVVPVIHAEGDGIWVSSVEGFHVGMQVAQVSGTIEFLSHEFLSTWKERWSRHAEVPADRWDGVIAFAKNHLPRGHFEWMPLDAPGLASVIKTKKPTSAGGPDGVSICDLKAMPMSVLSNFCDMFREAESFGVWPDQVVSGKVSLLAKTAAPCSALDFRPITVLSLLYRCWSSYHAQHSLRQLDGLLPPGLAGSRPNKYAGQIWGGLLWEIESAYDVASDLGGVIADIQKAFNHLPRLAVMEICAHVGLPCSLLLGWTGALVGMTRRFQIRDHMTEALRSCTGVPEGCALSCVAMMIIDWTLHAWFHYMMPLARPLTYVDDWQVVTTDSSQLGAIMDHLVEIAGMFDLLLDERKTFTWSITSAGRTHARQCGFAVVSKTRNLGAHVQFARQHTNSVQVERVKTLQALWIRLRLSASPYRQKLRAILMSAWPKGLHAIAATTLSSQWFQTLRAGAVKGLNVDGAGCNAHLHMGLVEYPTHDPQFWSILQTFWFARDCGDAEQVEDTLSTLVAGRSNVPDNSISSTLLARLQTLGWHVLQNGQVCDQFGGFSIFEVSKQELEFRASLAWQRVVAAEVQHRKGFSDLHRVDPAHVRSWLKMLPTSDKALFHKVLNGSHFTQDVVSFSQPGVGPECIYCGSTDSRFHRFWQCEFFQAQREEFPPALWQLIPTLPEVLTSFGWSLKPDTATAWLTLLAQVQIHSPPRFLAAEDGVVNLFTDGSCLFQHDSDCRFAAWSVVYAPADALTTESCRIVDVGPLPGLLQSAYRAEVFAILRALECCHAGVTKVCLWTDCAAVVKRLRKCIAGYVPKPNCPHADLWISIFHLINQFPFGNVGVFKVAAHRCEQTATTAVEEWCFRNNNLADRAAVRANFSRPFSFWQLLHEHLKALQFSRDVSRHVQHVQLAISRAQVRYCDEVAQPTVLVQPDPVPAWTAVVQFETLPAAAVRWYGTTLVRLLLSWFLQGIDPGVSDVRWVAHSQLYVDFMLASGEAGPVHFTKWENGASLPLLGLRDVPFKTRTRWFTKVMREILRHMKIPVAMQYGRPHSETLALHTGVWALPWPVWRLELVDLWFSERLPTAATRGGKILDSLPLAQRDERFPPVVLTSAGL
jgi:ribonuclease HI